MRIISWNVNGIRAIYKKGGWQWLIDESPDVICIQETKASINDLPDEIKSPLGYYSYFNSHKEKKGYSGVAIFSKIKPEKAIFNIEGDSEGRVIELHFNNDDRKTALFNVYFPNGGGGPERLEYKLKFYDKFLKHTESLRNKGYSIIFCGDINTAHKEIDLARPKENEKNTGFLPEERAWIDKLVSKGYVDIFRNKNPNKANSYTYWDMKTFSRQRNVGWRIDYFFISSELVSKVKSTKILNEIYGSDHCPIDLNIEV